MIILFKPAEMLLRGVNRVRRAMYRAGVLRARRLPRPVISIGNVAIGGAGKTPTVIAIARHLNAQGFRVTILTRGYGRRDSSVTGPIDTLDATRWGDEPVLIKTSVPNADVIVGSNRHENAARYLASVNVDCFLLDDGFQHLQLARDLDIVIDAPDARWKREGASALRDADFVIERRLRVTGCAHVAGKKVFAFSGLADNEQFFRTVRECGATVVGTRGFADHHRYSDGDVSALRAAGARAGAELLATTEKDIVKISDPSGIVALGIEMIVEERVLEAVVGVVRARKGSDVSA